MATLELPYEKVYDLLHKCCTSISPDVLYLMKRAAAKETNPEAKTFLETMLKNVELAGQMDKPVCQSPGFPSVWIRWGEAMQPNLTNLMGNITQSVIEATKAGYIRPSIVHPLTRHNPGDSSGRGVPNYELRYEKDLPYCEIIVSAKGCGAELPNVAKILTPATLGKNYKGLKLKIAEYSVMQKIVRMIDWPVLFKILRRRNRHKNHPSSRQHDAVGELCLCTQTDNVRLALQKTGYIRR